MKQSNFNDEGLQVTIAGNVKDAKKNVDKTVNRITADKYAELEKILESDEVPEEYRYLVRGAVLKCSCGSHTRKLNLPVSHGVYISDHPMVNQYDCVVGDDQNITTFGVCNAEGNPRQDWVVQKLLKNLNSVVVPGSSWVYTICDEPNKIILVKEDGTNVKGYPCMPCIISKWQNAHSENIIENNGTWGSHRHDTGESYYHELDGDYYYYNESGGSFRHASAAALTEQSFLVCAYGGLIEPVTSGQENKDTDWISEEDDGNEQTGKN